MKTKHLIFIGIISSIVISIGVIMWVEYGMICNKAVLDHLHKHSNLFGDSVTYDTYAIETIGLPFGVHSWTLQECVDFTLEKRIFVELENEN